jgi:asparagine synthase (glutamine-hydrolysing)
MCGINGILRLGPAAPRVDPEVAVRSRDAMATRGPDGEGLWVSADGMIALGHRRLAIIDLSETGAQPMAYDGGRFQLVFNGEIYNYKELRDALEREGARFTSTSDSEVLLALYAREGTAMLGKLRGMFALAIWDAHARRLVLARDPYGIKPLYVAVQDGWLQFASQVKALEAGGHVGRELDPGAIVGFLLWGSVPEPRTIRKAIRAVPAGHVLVVEDGRVDLPRSYRDLRQLDHAWCANLAEALADSVTAHLVADVPVAVFLSAGIDSSVIAALAKRAAGDALTTLTMRFAEFAGTPSDEGPEAAAIARILGTRHVERTLTRDDLNGLWPRVLAAMDQPSVDGFNTYVVSRVAHEAGFKVVLSGLGGDELFGGYESFRDVPLWARRTQVLAGLPGVPAAWRATMRRFGRSRPKLAGLLRYGGTIPGAYFVRRGVFLPEELTDILGDDMAVEGLREVDPVRAAKDAIGGPGAGNDSWVAVHLMESTLYMRNQLLRDSDWASMAHSLELRVPLVDVRLRDQIAALGFEPARHAGKAAVAAIATPELPVSVGSRPKTGFSIPLARALAGDDAQGLRGGLGARRIALSVLEEFGIPVRASGIEPLTRTSSPRWPS